jgi:8-oxo-dGTP diphosphatase
MTLLKKSFDSDKKPRVGVACVVQKDGAVLLGKRKSSLGHGSWGLPGGHLEFGESVEECARRELLEETGLKPISMRLGPWTENILDEGTKHYITIFIFIDQFEGQVVLLEPQKCEQWDWFSWGLLPEPLFAPIPHFLKKTDLFK